MSKMFTGSINLTKLISKAKERHSGFSKAEKSGDIWVNIVIWENDEKDQYGNTLSLQLNSTKEKREEEGKTYIGNGKVAEAQAQQPVSEADAADLDAGLDDGAPW